MKQLLLLVTLCGIAAAQTTYTMTVGNYPPNPNFYCDASGHYPPTSFAQFHCRGIKLSDSTGAVVGSFFLFSPNEIELSLPGFGADPYKSSVIEFPETSPLPSTFQFTFRAVDDYVTPNVVLIGTATVMWKDSVGSRGWHYPELTAFQVTIQPAASGSTARPSIIDGCNN